MTTKEIKNLKLKPKYQKVFNAYPKRALALKEIKREYFNKLRREERNFCDVILANVERGDTTNFIEADPSVRIKYGNQNNLFKVA